MTAAHKSRLGGSWADVRALRLTHAALFLVVYAVYGYQVCPYLETLTLLELVAPAALALAFQFAIAHVAARAAGAWPIDVALSRGFWIDVAAAIGLGFCVGASNFLIFEFPPESGAKVVLAFSALGIFAALDAAFEREIRLARTLREAGAAFPQSARFLPFQTKFVAFSMINILVAALVVMLVVLKDVSWVIEEGAALDNAKQLILMELSFVICVLGGYIYRVIRQYGRKTEIALSEERDALRRVAGGNFDARVTVSSRDEFGEIASLTNAMIVKLSDTVRELEDTRDVTIAALVSIAAARDNETGMHILRTKLYVAEVAREISTTTKFSRVVDGEFIARLVGSAPLHDIGKVGVPDAILTKPGRLSPDEFDVMKTHAAIGASALAEADQRLGGSSFLEMARDIALSHHERWDGKGYPNGLAGEDIPLAARLMAIADVYDALRSRRVYKPAMPHSEARRIIADGRGTQFDPDLVDAFMRIEARIEAIAARHADEPPAADDAPAAAFAAEQIRLKPEPA